MENFFHEYMNKDVNLFIFNKATAFYDRRIKTLYGDNFYHL